MQAQIWKIEQINWVAYFKNKVQEWDESGTLLKRPKNIDSIIWQHILRDDYQNGVK